MAHYHLHNSVNQAHLQDLTDRLREHLAGAPDNPYDRTRADARVGTLVEVVRAMDKGVISAEDVREVFAHFRIPGFSFERWLAEMVDEGVYLETALNRAA